MHAGYKKKASLGQYILRLKEGNTVVYLLLQSPDCPVLRCERERPAVRCDRRVGFTIYCFGRACLDHHYSTAGGYLKQASSSIKIASHAHLQPCSLSNLKQQTRTD
jgi:hypothetical protein